MDKSTEGEESYVILVEKNPPTWNEGSSVFMVPESEYKKLFHKTEDCGATVYLDGSLPHECGKNDPDVGYCNCSRVDSFLCNHEFNHVKSCFTHGYWPETPYKIVGVEYLDLHKSRLV